jgi:hypothetical protein
VNSRVGPRCFSRGNRGRSLSPLASLIHEPGDAVRFSDRSGVTPVGAGSVRRSSIRDGPPASGSGPEAPPTGALFDAGRAWRIRIVPCRSRLRPAIFDPGRAFRIRIGAGGPSYRRTSRTASPGSCIRPRRQGRWHPQGLVPTPRRRPRIDPLLRLDLRERDRAHPRRLEPCKAHPDLRLDLLVDHIGFGSNARKSG